MKPLVTALVNGNVLRNRKMTDLKVVVCKTQTQDTLVLRF